MAAAFDTVSSPTKMDLGPDLNLTSEDLNLTSAELNFGPDLNLTPEDLNLASAELNFTSASDLNFSDSDLNLSSAYDLNSTSAPDRNLSSVPDLNLSSASDIMGLTVVDPVTASFCLYSLIAMQDKTLEQVLLVDNYIISLTEKIVQGARNGGHVGHGILLLTRKCVAEGVRHVLLHVATHKYRQVRQCYNYMRRTLEGRDDLLEDAVIEDIHDHEVTKIARGLSLECCAFQRPC